jgi:hypothetical protein
MTKRSVLRDPVEDDSPKPNHATVDCMEFPDTMYTN